MKIYCSNPLAQYLKYKEEIDSAISNVLTSGSYILSEEVESLEEEFANYLNCRHVVGVANGTDAIELVLRALDIGYGDEVITVSHTAVATISAIQATGAKPVLADIDRDSYTMDTNILNSLINSKTKAIIPVHIYGRAANILELNRICTQRDLYLIEDCAQAHGLRLESGDYVGTIGIAGCFSCYPTKNLGGIGDSGLISTNSIQLADKLRSIRQYGWDLLKDTNEFGRNSRIDEIQAAILRVKLKYLDNNNNLRRDKAYYYKKRLKEYNLILPNPISDEDHVYHLYVVLSSQRDKLRLYLDNMNIQTSIHYPLPIHKQKAFYNKIQTANQMSNTEFISDRILSLPMYPEISNDQIDYICNSIDEFYSLSI